MWPAITKSPHRHLRLPGRWALGRQRSPRGRARSFTLLCLRHGRVPWSVRFPLVSGFLALKCGTWAGVAGQLAEAPPGKFRNWAQDARRTARVLAVDTEGFIQ